MPTGTFGYALVRVMMGHTGDAIFATAAAVACLLIYSVLYVIGPSKASPE